MPDMPIELTNIPPSAQDSVFVLTGLPPTDVDHPTPYITSHTCVLRFQEGTATIVVDQSEYEVGQNTWVFLSPYQPFSIKKHTALVGCAMYFHYDFFCLEAKGNEVGCNEVLFNTPYRTPLVTPNAEETSDLTWLIERVEREIASNDLAHDTLIVSCIKSLLVIATRAKLREPIDHITTNSSDNLVTSTLRRLIEERFREKLSLAAYADLLGLSPRALERLIRITWRKPLSQITQERLMIEAKRELYLTIKPVKTIARDLGFNDEYYFSRFFKKLAGVSPRDYRETVGMGRG
jgi:AraC family transcriptional regulator, transcriptional activator of pobA